jgi:hypothetical protein
MTTMVITVSMDGILKFWHDNVLFRALLHVATTQTWVWLWKLNLIYANALLQSIKIDFGHAFILIVNIYSEMNFCPCFKDYLFSKNAFRCHSIWQNPWVKNSKTNCSDIFRTAFGSTEALLKYSFSSKRYNLAVYDYIWSGNQP